MRLKFSLLALSILLISIFIYLNTNHEIKPVFPETAYSIRNIYPFNRLPEYIPTSKFISSNLYYYNDSHENIVRFYKETLSRGGWSDLLIAQMNEPCLSGTTLLSFESKNYDGTKMIIYIKDSDKKVRLDIYQGEYWIAASDKPCWYDI